MFDFENDCVFIPDPSGYQDMIAMRGDVELKLFDASGNLKESHTERNLIVNAGLNWLAKQLAGVSANAMSHIAVGTSATAAAASQTSLQGSELGRVAVDSKTVSANQVTIIATFPAGTATGTLNEAAIFDGSSGTVMFSRMVFAGGAVNKASSDSFQITWIITFNAA